MVVSVRCARGASASRGLVAVLGADPLRTVDGAHGASPFRRRNVAPAMFPSCQLRAALLVNGLPSVYRYRCAICRAPEWTQRASVLAGALRIVVVAVSVRLLALCTSQRFASVHTPCFATPRAPAHFSGCRSTRRRRWIGALLTRSLRNWLSAARCLRYALVVLRVTPNVTACSRTSFSRITVLRDALVALRVTHAVRSRSVLVGRGLCAARSVSTRAKSVPKREA